ncbi:MAG TPA: outer membrane beta-barrel protein [Kiritimatiellia bacterium]|jgi:hypothetical protein
MIRRLLILVGLLAAPAFSEQGPHRVGGGANYFVAIENLDANDVDEDGFGYFVSYQYRPHGPAGLEIDMEMLPKGYAASEDDIYSPQAYLILGSYVYLAAGIGAFYTDHELADDPFYALRAGAELGFDDRVFLDLYAIYRFEKWDDLSESEKNVGSDTAFVGAALRFAL